MKRKPGAKVPDLKDARRIRNEQQLQARIEQIRKSQPGRGVEFYVLAGELAAKVNVDVGDVMEEFDERAAVREYLGGVTRAEAERLAWCDVEQRYLRQTRMIA